MSKKAPAKERRQTSSSAKGRGETSGNGGSSAKTAES